MKKFLFGSFVLAASSVAFASSTAVVTFTALPTTQGNGTSISQGNTYNGESTATINGIPSQDLVCDDFDGSTVMPSGQIDFSVESLSSLSGSMFTSGYAAGLTGESTNGMSQVQAYSTAAVLLANLEKSGNTAQQITDYQYALWDLMTPAGVDGSAKDSPLDTNAANYLQSAFNAATATSPTSQTIADEKNLVIYTPTTAYVGNQEFLGMSTTLGTNTGTAPEPSTWILLAALGLVLTVPQVRSRLSAALPRN